MKIATKKTLQTVMLVALCASAAGVTTYVVNKKTASKQEPTVVVEQNVNNPFAMKTARSAFSGQPVDFTEAAEKTVHGVVHIKSTVNGRTQVVQEMPDIFEYFLFMIT